MKYLLLSSLSLLLFACGPKSPTTESSPPDYLSLGDSITQAAQATLLQHVGKAMKAGGPVEAIGFCNLEASPIMDSLSQQFGATISRISFQARNPDNAVNSQLDSLQLAGFGREEAPTSTLVEADGHAVYYKAIRIGMETCLKCHGQPETDIAPATLAKLQELYPKDLATGYQMGDLRGAWKVGF